MKNVENSMSVEGKKKQRFLEFDILRIIAILMVLFNHRITYTEANVIDAGYLVYTIKAILSLLCKCGPPIFFMISGALILRKDEPFKKTLVHRILKMVVVMILCAAYQCILESFSIINTIQILFFGLNWYFYAYLGFLFMSPFLRVIVKHSDQNTFLLYFYLVSLFYIANGVLILFDYVPAIFGNVPLLNANWASSSWSIVFPIVGYLLTYIDEIITVETKRERFINAILFGSIISVVLGVVLTGADIVRNTGVNLEMIRQHFIFLPTCAIFILMKKVSLYPIFSNKKVIKIIQVISSTTFGMFILEVNSQLSWKIYNLLSNAIVPDSYFVALLSIFVQFIVYFVIIYIVKKIPLIQRII